MKNDRLTALEILANAPWLKGLAPGLPEILVKEGRLERYPAGRWRQAAGDPGIGVTVIIEGAVALYCQGSANQVVQFMQVGPGAAFGHSLSTGGGSNVTAVCVEPTLVLSVTQSAIQRLSETEPELLAAVVRLAYLNARTMLQQIADLIGLPARQRLAASLLQLSQGKARGWITVGQGGLAEMIGVTRKTANQFLTEFEREGWIELGRNRLRILDRAALTRALHHGDEIEAPTRSRANPVQAVPPERG
ncbi:MAG TPA: Crp/Fnr family transcriptional regulator [Caulobacteraceae bacterium]|jgi:CRP-like cAMP-binding protein